VFWLSSPHRCLILPRSRHLPTASTDGSLSEHFNKTAVRLWSWLATALAVADLQSGEVSPPGNSIGPVMREEGPSDASPVGADQSERSAVEHRLSIIRGASARSSRPGLTDRQHPMYVY
jgi:hypothetical protein